MMSSFTVRALLLAGVGAALAAGVWWHQASKDELVSRVISDERRKVEEAAREKLADAELRAIGAETKATIVAMEGKIEQDKLKARASADASVLRGELGRLRAVLDGYHGGGGQAGEGAGSWSGPDAAGPLATALGECSERYAGVAEVADRLSIQVTGLQQYITHVVAPICIAQAQP